MKISMAGEIAAAGEHGCAPSTEICGGRCGLGSAVLSQITL